jgi:putative lipoic acid-binding regulatory protein
LLDLPCTYSFKVIGEAAGPYEVLIFKDVEQKLGRALDSKDYSIRKSPEGKQVSITFHFHITSPEEIFDMYALLKANKGTRYLL